MSHLVHVVYSNEAAHGLTEDAVRQMLDRARAHNAEVRITGMLLLVDRSFFQVIEGAPATVARLYDRIALDPRHSRMVKLLHEPIERREFRDWSMGLASATAAELASLPGLNDFFSTATSLHRLGEGNARKLLSAFQRGAWRARVA